MAQTARYALAFVVGLGVECILALLSSDLIRPSYGHILLVIALALSLFVSNNVTEKLALSVKWITVGAIVGALLVSWAERDECVRQVRDALPHHSSPPETPTSLSR